MTRRTHMPAWRPSAAASCLAIAACAATPPAPVAPPAPATPIARAQLAQRGHGDGAAFALCRGDACPQRTPKTLAPAAVQSTAPAASATPALPRSADVELEESTPPPIASVPAKAPEPPAFEQVSVHFPFASAQLGPRGAARGSAAAGPGERDHAQRPYRQHRPCGHERRPRQGPRSGGTAPTSGSVARHRAARERRRARRVLLRRIQRQPGRPGEQPPRRDPLPHRRPRPALSGRQPSPALDPGPPPRPRANPYRHPIPPVVSSFSLEHFHEHCHPVHSHPGRSALAHAQARRLPLPDGHRLRWPGPRLPEPRTGPRGLHGHHRSVDLGTHANRRSGARHQGPVGFVGFVVALISLSALRNFGPVLFYVGLAIFAAVGLVIAGAIMGAVV